MTMNKALKAPAPLKDPRPEAHDDRRVAPIQRALQTLKDLGTRAETDLAGALAAPGAAAPAGEPFPSVRASIPEPSWQQAFVTPDGARFTRTPDRVVRRDRRGRAIEAPPREAEAADEPATAPVMDEVTIAEAPAPIAASLSAALRAVRHAPMGVHHALLPRPQLYRIESPLAEDEIRELDGPVDAWSDEVPAAAPEPQAAIEPDLAYLALYADLDAPRAEVRAEAEATPEEPVAVLPPPAQEPPRSAPQVRAPALVRAAPRPPRAVVPGGYEFPSLDYLAEPAEQNGPLPSDDVLEEGAGRLEKVVRDFGVKGEVVHVRPGPVVTLYEL
ncbi:DNA translocase FtsK, partial [Salinarimonas soli]